MSARRIALGGAALVALAAAARPFESHAQTAAPAHAISIATLAPTGSTWVRALEAWNRELRRRSGGTLSLRLYPNGVQGDEAELVRKIRAGRLDAGAMTAVGLAQIHRPTIAFQLPGLFANYTELDRSRSALRSELDTAFQHAGYELLGWGDVGNDRIFATSAIHTPQDFARTHPFVWRDDPIGRAFVEETGAHGVEMQVPEVLTALQTHTIDSLTASPLAVASMQWAAQLPHMTDLSTGIEIGAIVIGHSQFDALTPDQRALLRETATQFTTLMVRNVRRDDDGTIPQMQSRGVAIVTPTAAERSQWEAVFTRTRARLTGQIADAAWIERVRSAAH
jgi:TRAP-type C4-dicarboxylate transport system substrate-binding protein